jgi:hypothetical protein
MADLVGDWNSYYRYPSTGRGEDFWGQDLLHAKQEGNKLTLETGSDSSSHQIAELELSPDGTIAQGVWAEDTDPDGFYEGRRFEGTVEFKITADGQRMSGIWHGAGRDGRMHSDVWELAKTKSTKQPDSNKPKRWKLTHWYPSLDDTVEEFEVHDMNGYWTDDMLVLESLPREDGSYLLARLHLQDDVASGSWHETVSVTAKNSGVQYSGNGQLMVDPKTYRMEGLWAGAGYDYKLKGMRIYTGRWEIVPAEA